MYQIVFLLGLTSINSYSPFHTLVMKIRMQVFINDNDLLSIDFNVYCTVQYD